jgi:hypothetical protein
MLRKGAAESGKKKKKTFAQVNICEPKKYVDAVCGYHPTII